MYIHFLKKNGRSLKQHNPKPTVEQPALHQAADCANEPDSYERNSQNCEYFCGEEAGCFERTMGMLGGGFRYFLFSPRKLGKIPILTHIFQMGWFNHQLGMPPPAQRNRTLIAGL